MGRYSGGYWPRYVPVAERHRRAVKTVASMKKAGREISPIQSAGRKIATTFWGEAWCKNLEAYSDYANRLPRGRTYVRNGSVLDLSIKAGRVRTLVSGRDLYRVDIAIKPLAQKRWMRIKRQCAGEIASLVELLRGSISRGVMQIVTRKGEGLFPSPREITLRCSCPDWATMCKHVAASLYGVGVRLDQEPELLFTLRGVDPTEMLEAAVQRPTGNGKTRKGRGLKADELSSVFGVDIDLGGVSPASTTARTRTRAPKARKPTTGARDNGVAGSASTKAAAGNAVIRSTTKKNAAKRAKVTKKAAATRAAVKKATKTTAKRAAKKTSKTMSKTTKSKTTKSKTTKSKTPAKAGRGRSPTRKMSSANKRTAGRVAPKSRTRSSGSGRKA